MKKCFLIGFSLVRIVSMIVVVVIVVMYILLFMVSLIVVMIYRFVVVVSLWMILLCSMIDFVFRKLMFDMICVVMCDGFSDMFFVFWILVKLNVDMIIMSVVFMVISMCVCNLVVYDSCLCLMLMRLLSKVVSNRWVMIFS